MGGVTPILCCIPCVFGVIHLLLPQTLLLRFSVHFEVTLGHQAINWINSPRVLIVYQRLQQCRANLYPHSAPYSIFECLGLLYSSFELAYFRNPSELISMPIIKYSPLLDIHMIFRLYPDCIFPSAHCFKLFPSGYLKG